MSDVAALSVAAAKMDSLVIGVSPYYVSDNVTTPKQLVGNGRVLIVLTHPVMLFFKEEAGNFFALSE